MLHQFNVSGLARMPMKYEKLTFIISPRETCDAECADNLAAYIWWLCLAIVTVSCFPGIHVELSGRLRNCRTWFSSVVNPVFRPSCRCTPKCLPIALILRLLLNLSLLRREFVNFDLLLGVNSRSCARMLTPKLSCF